MARQKFEEDQRRREEEEALIAQRLEEERLADPDQPIEQAKEKIYQQLMNEKMKVQQDQSNFTRTEKDFSRPAIALGTVLAAKVMKEFEKGQRIQ